MADKEKLEQFIKEVEGSVATYPLALHVHLEKSLAIEAAEYIKNAMAARRRGGINARGRSGRKVEFEDRAHRLHRERMSRYRANKKAPSK